MSPDVVPPLLAADCGIVDPSMRRGAKPARAESAPPAPRKSRLVRRQLRIAILIPFFRLMMRLYRFPPSAARETRRKTLTVMTASRRQECLDSPQRQDTSHATGRSKQYPPCWS